MKIIMFFAALLVVPLANAEYVRGYRNLDGTYVQGYYRNSFNVNQDKDNLSQSVTNINPEQEDTYWNDSPYSRSIYDQDDAYIEKDSQYN